MTDKNDTYLHCGLDVEHQLLMSINDKVEEVFGVFFRRRTVKNKLP